MSGYVDVHAHVLPGIDDGPEDLPAAIAMAEVAEEAGTVVLAATPHLRADWPLVVPGEIAARVAELAGALRAAGRSVRIVGGAEVALPDAERIDDDTLRTVCLGDGDVLLLETPHAELPDRFEERVLAVAERGVRVLLAHPELSAQLRRDPARLERLLDRGVMAQVTARSLREPRGSAARELAWRVVAGDRPAVIASDAHSNEWRRPVLGEHVELAAQAVPGAAERLRWMATDAPAALLAGRDPGPGPRASVPAPRRRSWLRNR